MELVYLILFLVGLGYAVVNVVLGDLFGMDAGEHLPFLSPITIAAFITVFGGVGTLLHRTTDSPELMIGLLAACAALAVSMLLYFAVMVPMYRAEKSTAFSNRDMIGGKAEVLTAIAGTLRGEIIYEQGGSRLSGPAISLNGSPIAQGEIVEIADVVSGTFIVKPLLHKSDSKKEDVAGP